MDPVEAIWPDAERMLEETPELEAKMVFEHLLASRPHPAWRRVEPGAPFSAE